MNDGQRIATYREFWTYYLREHSRRGTRGVHFVGTGLSTACLLAVFASGNLWFVPLALFTGYGPAWAGHFLIERNRPATFTYPLWSLVSDYRMAWTWLTGGLREELVKAGVRPR